MRKTIRTGEIRAAGPLGGLAAIVLAAAIILAMAIVPASAATVLELNFMFHRANGSAELSSASAMEGTETILSSNGEADSRFLLEVTDDGGNKVVAAQEIPVSFYILTEPPKPVESVPVTVRIPFSSEEKKIRLTSLPSGDVVLLQDLSLCNRDSRCGPGENHASCGDDCKQGGKDGYCEPARDGICDPDCDITADADCIPRGRPAGAGIGTAPIVIGATLAGIAAAFYLIFFRK